MDSRELESRLRSYGVPRSMYTIGGDADEAYCLVLDGANWLVYYSERGNKNDLRIHVRESDACSDLMKRVLSEFERDEAWRRSHTSPSGPLP